MQSLRSWKQNMSDYLDVLARVAQVTIESGYYNSTKPQRNAALSLKKAILDCKVNPVIAEIKAASPSAGVIRKDVERSRSCKGDAERRRRRPCRC